MSDQDTLRYDSPQDQLRKEADFVVKEITLLSYNGKEHGIEHLYLNLRIKEGLFQNSITGTIVFYDAINLPQLLPLIGEERIRIVFSRQDLVDYTDEIEPYEQEAVQDPLREIDVEFRIVKMSGRKQKNEREQIYTLHFVSDEFIKNIKSKEQKSYKGKLYSEIAESIFNDSLKVEKPLVAEETHFKQDYVCCNIPPFEVLNQIASRSVGENGSAYLFFEDREQFNFCSLGKLVKQEPVKQKYLYHVSNVLKHFDGEARYKPRNIEIELQAVEEFFYKSSYNVLGNLMGGMYAGRMLTVDPIRQIWDTIDFELDKEFSSFKHLEDKKFFTDDSDVFGSPKSYFNSIFTNLDHDKTEHIKEKEPGIKPHHKEDVLLKRKSYFQQINNHKLRIVLSGDPRRKSGQVLEFFLPNFLANTSDDPQELDKYLHGKYLILNIEHRLSVNSYYMILDIVKDSYVEDIEYEDPYELYKDTY